MAGMAVYVAIIPDGTKASGKLREQPTCQWGISVDVA
jgi:hypothetical protein